MTRRKRESKVTLMACPKCKGTAFKQYLVEIPTFFPRIAPGSPDLVYEMSECVGCGWRSHPTDSEGAREVLSKALRREFDPSNCFVKAEEASAK